MLDPSLPPLSCLFPAPQPICVAWFSIRNGVAIYNTHRNRLVELREDRITFHRYEGAPSVGGYRLQSIQEMHLHHRDYDDYPFRVMLVIRNMAGFTKMLELFTRSPQVCFRE